MSKIHTVEQLFDLIDDETAWRKQELSTTFGLIQRTTGVAHAANLRAGVLILYAHWEGWVKNVAQLYVRHVNTRGLFYEQLSDAFLAHALKVKIGEFDQASKSGAHNKFVAFIRGDLGARAKLSEELVRTDSNLSSQVFFDIVERLGLPARPAYESRATLIDRGLVSRRNTIAHGQYLDLNSSDFSELREGILYLLGQFTDDIRNAAVQQDYLIA